MSNCTHHSTKRESVPSFSLAKEWNTGEVGERSVGFSSLTTQSVDLKLSKLPTTSTGRGARVELPAVPSKNACVPTWGECGQPSTGEHRAGQAPASSVSLKQSLSNLNNKRLGDGEANCELVKDAHSICCASEDPQSVSRQVGLGRNVDSTYYKKASTILR